MHTSPIIEAILFLIFSVPLVWVSWRSLSNVHNHGLHRLISWECILWLLIKNYSYWFVDQVSVHQIVSWTCLLVSLGMLIPGVISLKRTGKADANRKDDALYEFEKTTQLVEIGIFKYVRHPLYSSLLFLTWGIFFKRPDLFLGIVSLVSTAFLFLTALFEEKEDLRQFGGSYSAYKKKTKMFIPFLV